MVVVPLAADLLFSLGSEVTGVEFLDVDAFELFGGEGFAPPFGVEVELFGVEALEEFGVEVFLSLGGILDEDRLLSFSLLSCDPKDELEDGEDDFVSQSVNFISNWEHLAALLSGWRRTTSQGPVKHKIKTNKYVG